MTQKEKILLEARKEAGVINKPFNPLKWLKCQELTCKKTAEAIFKDIKKIPSEDIDFVTELEELRKKWCE